MVVWATRAFLLGLVGHSWLEVGVRSWYAEQNARIPLLGAVFQICLYLPLAIFLSERVGHTGLALADTLAFTSQALLLLILLNRRHPGILRMQGTLLRASLGALLGGVVAYAALQLSLPVLPALGLGLAAGCLAALPLILPEIKMLIKL